MITATSHEWSVAMTADLDGQLGAHLHRGARQEDCAFGYWYPSEGATRTTAILREIVWPGPDDRVLDGNVAFTEGYLRRAIAGRPAGGGIAFMHGHLGPGWQGMSRDDVTAERDRLADVVLGATGHPLVGLTRGTDGSWGGRAWERTGPRTYERQDARTVRVVGRHLKSTFHPDDEAPAPTARLGETATVWGRAAHANLSRTRFGVIGLGSVGSLVAQGVARMGIGRQTYVDHDRLEWRNLDRTVAATAADVVAGLSKVAVAGRATAESTTVDELDLRLVEASLLDPAGYRAALDCDILIACVDRPLPRWVLNAMAYSHLIPVVDGGISARVRPSGRPLHVAWRISSVGPERGCLVCGKALRRSDMALDREGKLDDPDYIAGLSERDRGIVARRNVFPFSMATAAHQLLQAVGIVTGYQEIGGTGVQLYNGYPGTMEVERPSCEPGCETAALLAQPADLLAGLVP